MYHQAQTIEPIQGRALTASWHFISMSGEKQLAGSCRIDSPAPLIFTPSPSFFYFLCVFPLSALFAYPSTLARETVLILILHPARRSSPIPTLTAPDDLKKPWFLCSGGSSCAAAWTDVMSVKNARQSDEDTSGQKTTHWVWDTVNIPFVLTRRCRSKKEKQFFVSFARCLAAVTQQKKGNKDKKRNKTVLPDAGDLLRCDWITVLGEHRLTEPDILP